MKDLYRIYSNDLELDIGLGSEIENDVYDLWNSGYSQKEISEMLDLDIDSVNIIVNAINNLT